MPAPIAATVFPEYRQFVGIGREAATGTSVLPVTTLPVEKAEPDEKVTFLTDKSLRGSMAEEYALIQGVEVSDFNFGGPVYLDTMGYVLHNLMGDYVTTGSTPTNSTTLTAPVAVGATTAAVTSGTGYAIGQAVQLGVSGDGNPEVVVLTNVVTNTLTFANTPARFAHASGKAVSTVVAPFSHVFSLLNSGNGQPVTHTVTHYQGITSSFGARQYASWCASEVAFDLDAQMLLTHETKGTSFLGVPAASGPTNSLTTALAQPVWRLLVGIGGPASGGTQVNNVCQGGVTITRQIKPYFTGDGYQQPFIIARNGLAIAGKFTQLAQDESPLLNMLNNVQPQVQMTLSNGLTGANLLAITFDCQVAAYDTSKLSANEELEYEVTFKGIANTTNAGQSGGYAPGKVTLQNAIPTY
jgi:hypothetical protein